MRTRAPHQLVGDAFGLYRRYPLLFLALASAVIVPFAAILLVVTGDGPFDQSSLDYQASMLLTLIELALIGPLVSALHVHAVAAAREGRDPEVSRVARQGLKVLPVVVAASIMSWLGITVGFFILVVPGVILTLRWFVVAQAAAIEHEGWLAALRRSGSLVSGNYGFVFVLLIYIGLITFVPALLAGFVIGDDSTTVVSFVVGLIVQIFLWSFTALVTALAYFELRGRNESSHAGSTSEESDSTPAATSVPREGGGSWDPHDYTEAERPRGWYVDPSDPSRMRYWDAGDPPRWGATTRTPRQIQRAWEEKYPGGSP